MSTAAKGTNEPTAGPNACARSLAVDVLMAEAARLETLSILSGSTTHNVETSS